MDAMVDGQPVTPRKGKAVEVQALWYNALRTVELLADRFREPGFAENCRLMAERIKTSFIKKFWNAEKKYLYDVVDGQERDGSFRPNQILAVSLDSVMLDGFRNESVVDVVQRELLTPYGLRTLDRSDPRYVGVYVGDRRSRDRAYHNGTVWPWLIGPFATAYLKVKGHADFRREFAWKNFLSSLTGQVFEAGLGSVSEVFDGDPPHLPRGCIAQAWSVAELLRTYVEDVMLIRPPFEKSVLGAIR
jgi:glycogen debranching enzyme